MSVNVGGIHYVVDARTEGLLRAEREVDTSMRSVEKSTERADQKFNSLTASIKRATVALVSVAAAQAAIKAVTSQVAEFEQSLLTVRAVTRANEDQMASLEKQARELGATTSFAAKQAADAQGELARMGFEVNEVLAVTPGVLKFAMAAELGLADAAKIASGTLRGMRLEVDQMPRVMDVLAATAANAGTNVMQMGEAMTNAAPFAAGLGVEIEETSAALGILANSNIQGGSSGTALMSLFRQLSNITPQARKQLEAYGLSVEDLSVRTRGLANVMDSLMQSGIMTNDGAMFQIFGSEGQAAAQILMSNVAGLREFTGELQNASGEVDKMAEILGSGLSTSMKGFGSAVSEAVLVLGRDSGFGAALQGVLDTSAGVINNLSGMTEQMGALGEEGSAQQIVINGLADGLRILAAILAGRMAQAVAGSTLSWIAARREAYRYQMALATMSGVSHRAAASQLAMAGATRAASAAFALIGGPAGAIVIAALAVYKFRAELGLVPRVAQTAEEKLAELEGRLDGIEESSENARLELARFSAELFATHVQADRLRERLKRLQEQQNNPNNFGQGMQGDIRAGIQDTETRLEEAEADLEAYAEMRRRALALVNGEDPTKPQSSDSDNDPPITPPSTPPSAGSGEDEAKRRQREFEAVQRQLATERETIESEYRKRNEAIMASEEATAEEKRVLLARSEAERERQSKQATERTLSGLRSESEQIQAELERRNERILADEGLTGSQRQSALENSYTQYLDRLKELQELEREQEREHYAQRLQQITGFSDQAVQKLLEIQKNAGDPMAALTRNLGDAFVNLDDTIASAFMNGMQNAEGMNDILKSIGQTVLGSLLQSFVKLGVQMLINAAMGKAAGTAAATASMAQGQAVLAAWSPAAIAVNTATFGAASGVGLASYLSAQAAGAMASLAGGAKGFASGGYTGTGSRNTPAGIVHRGEYVMPKHIVDQPGMRQVLEALHRGEGLHYPVNESGEHETLINSTKYLINLETSCRQ
ncbi:phage tail tape measure protein [Vreelandella alkaliphila]|uniref:phage tail tape measure protein n=1 Tax=Vreelandella alkaliphila TaxID=272774 RepID=UPI0039F44D10